MVFERDVDDRSVEEGHPRAEHRGGDDRPPVDVPIRMASDSEWTTCRKVAFTVMSTSIAASSAAERRLVEHVDRRRVEHPPIDLDSSTTRVRNPVEFEARFGHVLDYMARVELEVDRNVLQPTTTLLVPPEIDRVFYADVLQLEEIRTA